MYVVRMWIWVQHEVLWPRVPILNEPRSYQVWNTLKGIAAADSCPGSTVAWTIYTRSTIIIILLGPIVQAIQDICHVWICRWLIADLSGSCLFMILLWNCLGSVIEPFLVKYFDNKVSIPLCCAVLHGARCLCDCVLLTCPQTVITSFYFYQ
jgi:hypothetical protein